MEHFGSIYDQPIIFCLIFKPNFLIFDFIAYFATIRNIMILLIFVFIDKNIYLYDILSVLILIIIVTFIIHALYIYNIAFIMFAGYFNV